MTMMPDDNKRRTIHDYIGSLAFMPNEPQKYCVNEQTVMALIKMFLD